MFVSTTTSSSENVDGCRCTECEKATEDGRERQQRRWRTWAGIMQASSTAEAATPLPQPKFIPGLLSGHYRLGSWHSAPTPTLLRLRINGDGEIDAEWSAKGSSSQPYTIKVTGKVPKVPVQWTDSAPTFGDEPGGLQISCSCPSGEDQAAANALARRQSMSSLRECASTRRER